MRPSVSVIIPSYNHAKYVGESLESVMNQTFQDFEIIITDDGSTDRTVEVIKKYNDPRIKLFLHPENRGACVAANNCIRHSNGHYIAMLSSDDIWHPDKLALQVKYLEEHPEIGVVFGKVTWIDDESREIFTNDFPYQFVFEVENRNRFEWLRYFFKYGNCLCHPCSLVRRECYDKLGLLNPVFANLPDFDLWVRICFKYNIHILNEKLICFRRIGENINASGCNISNRIRINFEYKQILNQYLQIVDVNTLLSIFPEVVNYGEVAEDLIPYYLGCLAIDEKIDFKMLWGLELINNLLNNEACAHKLKDKFNFTYRDFIRLSTECNSFNLCSIQPPPLLTKVNLHSLELNADDSFLGMAKTYFREIKSIIRKFLSLTKNYIRKNLSILVQIQSI